MQVPHHSTVKANSSLLSDIFDNVIAVQYFSDRKFYYYFYFFMMCPFSQFI